jgi:hypothetical protein
VAVGEAARNQVSESGRSKPRIDPTLHRTTTDSRSRRELATPVIPTWFKVLCRDLSTASRLRKSLCSEALSSQLCPLFRNGVAKGSLAKATHTQTYCPNANMHQYDANDGQVKYHAARVSRGTWFYAVLLIAVCRLKFRLLRFSQGSPDTILHRYNECAS